MTETGSHPAVLAGLLGSAVWGVAPTVALASPLDDVVEAVSGSLLLQFVAGCAIGAAVAGVISFVADRLAGDEDDEEVEDASAEVDDDFWRTSSLNIIQAQEEVGEDDPTGDLGRYRTGQITIDFPALAEEAVAQAITGPRHFAPATERRPEKRTEKRSTRRAGRHFAGAAPKAAEPVVEKAPVLEKVVAASAKRGRHFATAATTVTTKAAPAVVETPVFAAAEPLVAAVAAEKVVTQTHELNRRARLAALPVIESRHAPVRVPQSMATPVPTPVAAASEPMPVANPQDTMDFIRLADKPAAKAARHDARNAEPAHSGPKPGFTGRLRMQMAARAKGVRAVLAERLGRDALDGVPIIERADGSISDVKPTWFDQTVVPALASITGVTARIEDTAPRMEQTTGSLTVETETPSRASYISRRVAEVNVGIFPERRSGEDLEHEDVWEEALAAMGETIAQSNPTVFQDVVGGPSTIDDPDGLEGPTGFIPFRVPAAHPEVVDTETYVDYLLRDEISQNGSPVLAHSPHAHLRVIEGGTGRLRMRKRSGDTGPVPQGRHFAQPSLSAAEA